MVIELLKKLINAESTAKTGELKSAEVLAGYCDGNGIESQIDCWGGNRANFCARIKGSGKKKALMFGGHLDVVPADKKAWETEPFVAVEKAGKIFGRGSCDMKAGNAAAIVAVAELLKERFEFGGDVIVCATAGEETDSCGAFRQVKSFNAEPMDLQGVIIPEPTNFEVVTAHRGICWLKIVSIGQTAHGSMPSLGVNAVTNIASLLVELSDYKPKCVAHKDFGVSSLSVNRVDGGAATNVVPDKCLLELDIRTVPGQSRDAVIDEIQALIEKHKQGNPSLNAKVELIRSVEALDTDSDSDFVRRICNYSGGKEPRTVGYTTDAPVFAGLGVPVVIYGPGCSKVCHQPDECIEINDVYQAVENYKYIIKKCLG